MTVEEFIAKRSGKGKRHARKLLEQGLVILNGTKLTNGKQALGKFDRLVVDHHTIQANIRRIVLLHKPRGVLSATRDSRHRTVIDLIHEPWADELHLAGRLDRSSTGLVILTNDSRFSESLTRPSGHVPKTYRVEVDHEIPDEAVIAFRSGMPFAKENVRSHPAVFDPISATACRLTIYEGLHHQIKRMFLRFGIRVTALHRESIGPFLLPDDLPEGKYRLHPGDTPE